MTKEVRIRGQRFKLYRVRRFAAAWCSDPGLAHRIEERYEQTQRKLRLTDREVKELVRF